ncbi:alpha/beta hydrolase [Planctomicrobium piriforme]|nr:alpha/beta hydrolase [Planctomicrobium piriforme]
MAVIALGLLLSVSDAACAQEPTQYRTIRDISYRDGTGLDDYAQSQCRLDLYVPEGKNDFATVIWFHGGGLTSGKREIPKRLMNQGLAIAAVSYRLSPHVTVSDCIDDAAAATAWVTKHIADYGGSDKKIIVSGHSAGGYLTAMIGLDKHWLQPYGVDPDTFAGLAPFSTQAITHFTARKEQGIGDKQPVIDKFAPLFHVRKDAPPILLLTGDREMEMLGRYEENAYFWRMLTLVGHLDVTLYEFDGYDHGGMADPGFPLLVKFVKRVTK